MMLKLVKTLAAASVVLASTSLFALACKSSDKQQQVATTPSASVTASASAQPRLAGTEVRVYMYSQYMDKELLTVFKDRTGATVQIFEYEDAESMKAQLQTAGGSKQYDVIVAPDYIIPILAEAGLIQPLDQARIPNLRNIAPKFRAQPYDAGNKLSVPYQWGTNGLVYKRVRDDFTPSWATLFAPDASTPKFVLLDSLRDTLGAALIHLRKSANSTNDDEVKAAGEAVLRAKKNPKCRGLFGSPESVDKVFGGEVELAMAYSGDALKRIIASKRQDLFYVVPKEGSIVWIDNMVLSKGAPNVAGAYAFIDFILDADIGAKLSNYLHYASPNEAAKPKLLKEDLNNPAIYPPEDPLKSLELLTTPKNLKTYDLVWTKAKSG